MSLRRSGALHLLLLAGLASGCASGSTVQGNGDLSGPGSDSGLDGASLADLAMGPDLRAPALFCGDGVCTPANEACDSCPADCGSCPPCPAGFGDCNNDRKDGCEANLNTAQNCGACGTECKAVGGTNACTLDTGTMTYGCLPDCDSTHGDCDGNKPNGCEALINTIDNCGSCGEKCLNPHGTTICSTTGGAWFCVPTCDVGWGACDAAKDGCTTDTSGDIDNCGACDRACSPSHVTSRVCTAGACKPVCTATYSDCATPISPAADDGCEAYGAGDTYEPDNACGQQQTMSVDEGWSLTRTINRILPSGDKDTVRVDLNEGSRICFPFTSQSYNARVVLSAPDGNLSLKTGNPATQCTNTWASYGNYVCVNWDGMCGDDDSLTLFFQVQGVSGSSSCQRYSLLVEYCDEGNQCPGC